MNIITFAGIEDQKKNYNFKFIINTIHHFGNYYC